MDTLERITEYGSPAYCKAGGATRAEIAQHGIMVGTKERTYRLIESSRGYECAGSMARWTDGYYAVLFHMDGAEHGRKFVKTSMGLANAKALFAKWTKADA